LYSLGVRWIAAATGGDAQIETVWGGGYMLRDDPKASVAA
jgi:hypothetical protein